MIERAGLDAHSALDTYTVSGALAFDSGYAELRDYRWRSATRDVWTSDGYFFNVCLSPWAAKPDATYLDCDGRVAGAVGRVLFVPPGRTVRSGCEAGRQRSLHCMLSTAIIEEPLDRAPSWTDVTLGEGLALSSPEIDHLLLRLQLELGSPGFGATIVAETLATALGIALIRRFRLDKPDRAPRIGGLAPWRMRRITERVADDGAAPGLGELAALTGMSVRHLSRAFRAETGISVARYVAQAQIARATDLLTHGDRPIADIARRTGFGSAASFSHAFRRATGMRPIDVRSRTRSAANA